MIHKKKLTHNYLEVLNSFATDSTISPNSKALYLYLLSKPADWDVSAKDIRNNCLIGASPSTISRAFKELEKGGYAKCKTIIKKYINKNGKQATQMAGKQYDIFQDPVNLPISQKTEPELDKTAKNSIKNEITIRQNPIRQNHDGRDFDGNTKKDSIQIKENKQTIEKINVSDLQFREKIKKDCLSDSLVEKFTMQGCVIIMDEFIRWATTQEGTKNRTLNHWVKTFKGNLPWIVSSIDFSPTIKTNVEFDQAINDLTIMVKNGSPSINCEGRESKIRQAISAYINGTVGKKHYEWQNKPLSPSETVLHASQNNTLLGKGLITCLLPIMNEFKAEDKMNINNNQSDIVNSFSRKQSNSHLTADRQEMIPTPVQKEIVAKNEYKHPSDEIIPNEDLPANNNHQSDTVKIQEDTPEYVQDPVKPYTVPGDNDSFAEESKPIYNYNPDVECEENLTTFGAQLNPKSNDRNEISEQGLLEQTDFLGKWADEDQDTVQS